MEDEGKEAVLRREVSEREGYVNGTSIEARES